LYFTVNKKTLEIYYGKKKGDRDIVHKIYKLNWVCPSDEPCSISDYGVIRGIDGFDQDMAEKLKELGVPNAKKCFILQFYDEDETTDLICVLDMT